MELRPLGFGEIFDRAITLYIRNFIPFAGIVSVFIVPVAVLQYFLDRASLPQWDSMMQILQHPGKSAPTPPPLPVFLTSPDQAALFVAVILVAWLLWPFALNACAVGVARLYRGGTVEFGACYRASLGRWRSVIGLLMLEVLIFIAWYLSLVAVVLLIVVGAVAVAQTGSGGVVISALLVFAGLLFVLAWLLVLAPLVVAVSFSMNAVVIEDRTAVLALHLGFTRVFNRREIGRASLFGLAAGAVMMAASALISVVLLIAVALHLILFEVFLSSLFRAAFTPFSVVLLAIYYFDVRIRREGFEIESELDRLTESPRVA
jgi:hypothetical protein